MFLQAAGMPARTTRQLEKHPTRTPLPPDLRALEGLFQEAHLGSLPDSLLRLGAAPHLLESQRELLEALLRRDNPTGPLLMDRERFRSVGWVVLQEIGALRLRDRVADAIRQDG